MTCQDIIHIERNASVEMYADKRKSQSLFVIHDNAFSRIKNNNNNQKPSIQI